MRKWEEAEGGSINKDICGDGTEMRRWPRIET